MLQASGSLVTCVTSTTSGFLQARRRDLQAAFSGPDLPWSWMYDLAALGISAACFAFAWLVLWALGKV
jgi:hypothetical protein